MNALKQSLLSLYQAATARRRLREARRLAEEGHAPVCVLFYHRVADTHPNDWTLPTAVFARQIDWLARRFDFVSLAEAQRRLGRGRSERPAVAITFDDGYADNAQTAVPLLLARRVPFTYFVTTRTVRDQGVFPHDAAAGVPLRPNTVTEVRAMADAGVEIGAHTRTHPDLGASTDPDWLRDEIAGSLDDLQAWTGRRPRSFAFPYGLPQNMTPAAFDAAIDAGAECVVSAYGAYNVPGQVSETHGPRHVRRIHGDPEWVRFTNWMTFDPRKLHAVDPIDDDAWLPAPEAVASEKLAHA
ncbi:MAG: polysaccharide deacetylase family protein [Planctomycetota bacterium]